MDVILEVEKIDNNHHGIYLYIKNEIYYSSIQLKDIPVIVDINKHGDIYGIEIIDDRNVPTYKEIQEKAYESKIIHRLKRYGYYLQKSLHQYKNSNN